MSESDRLILRIALFIPPTGWAAKWLLPSEARKSYADTVVRLKGYRMLEEHRRRSINPEK